MTIERTYIRDSPNDTCSIADNGSAKSLGKTIRQWTIARHTEPQTQQVAAAFWLWPVLKPHSVMQ